MNVYINMKIFEDKCFEFLSLSSLDKTMRSTKLGKKIYFKLKLKTVKLIRYFRQWNEQICPNKIFYRTSEKSFS